MSTDTSKDTYNRGGVAAFIFSFGFSTIFLIAMSFFHPGIVGVDELEAMAAGAENGVPQEPAFDIESVDKTWEESEEVANYGKKVFAINCASCHGPGGKGDGPAGATLNPPPRDLVAGKWTQGGSSIALFKTATSGISGTSMVGFGHLSVEDRWAMVQYIRSITENKVKDDSAKLDAFANSAE